MHAFGPGCAQANLAGRDHQGQIAQQERLCSLAKRHTVACTVAVARCSLGDCRGKFGQLGVVGHDSPRLLPVEMGHLGLAGPQRLVARLHMPPETCKPLLHLGAELRGRAVVGKQSQHIEGRM